MFDAAEGRQSKAADERKHPRVAFAHEIGVQIMAIDGTWRRSCAMMDIGEKGAKLRIEGNLHGLNLKEFFLLLSSTGLAYRRCELVWLNGDKLGVAFAKSAPGKKKTER